MYKLFQQLLMHILNLTKNGPSANKKGKVVMAFGDTPNCCRLNYNKLQECLQLCASTRIRLFFMLVAKKCKIQDKHSRNNMVMTLYKAIGKFQTFF